MAHPERAGLGVSIKAGGEVFGQPLAGGEGLERAAVVAQHALGRGQPEVAGPVLGQGINERLREALGGAKLLQKQLLRAQGQPAGSQQDQ